jgi:hypothetical protein
MAEKRNIYEKLQAIQAALKAPKSQYNSFGKYKYRKAEDILEAVKPLLKEQGLALICTDDLVNIGDRYYIKATVTITDGEASIFTTAFAREEETKSGMDGSQITGASSSYARKYALNGLLCIDDTADSDTTNVGTSNQTPEAVRKTAAARKAATEQEPAPAKQKLSKEEMYWKVVEKEALGIKAKNGSTYRDAWINIEHPTQEQLEKFDHDVENVKLARQIPIINQ